MGSNRRNQSLHTTSHGNDSGLSRRRAAATLGLVILLSGCGIPQVVFLAPPILGSVTELPPTVTFEHDTANDTDSFLGYEVYYKFYDPDTSSSDGVEGELASDRSTIQSAAPGNAVSILRDRGYRRIYTSRFSDTPALRMSQADRGASFELALDFQQPETAHAVATWDAGSPEEVELYRDQNLFSNPQTPVGFQRDQIVAGHEDVPDTIAPGRTAIRMGIAVTAYGADFVTGTFAEVYSTAVVTDRLLDVEITNP